MLLGEIPVSILFAGRVFTGTSVSSINGLKVLFVVDMSDSRREVAGINTAFDVGTLPVLRGMEPVDRAGMLPFSTIEVRSIPVAAPIGAGVDAASAAVPSLNLVKRISDSPELTGRTDTPPSNDEFEEGVEGIRTLLGTGTGVGVALL